MEITVTVERVRPALRQRVTRIALLAPGIGAAVAALLGVLTGSAQHRATPGAGQSGPAGVAAAYGYPLRCLSVSLATEDGGYARADFDHAVPCGRYDGYATAIFRRVDGAWRPVVDALGYSCPVASVPRPVQVELGVCP